MTCACVSQLCAECAGARPMQLTRSAHLALVSYCVYGSQGVAADSASTLSLAWQSTALWDLHAHLLGLSGASSTHLRPCYTLKHSLARGAHKLLKGMVPNTACSIQSAASLHAMP
eukprot:630750-Pelagomonas_calceolata.AAC.3